LAFLEDVNIWHQTPALGTAGFGILLPWIAGMGMKTRDLSGNHGGIYVRAFVTETREQKLARKDNSPPVEDGQFSHLGEQCKIARKPPEKSVEPTQKLHKMADNSRKEHGSNIIDSRMYRHAIATLLFGHPFDIPLA
jgi:hypothetical protein